MTLTASHYAANPANNNNKQMIFFSLAFSVTCGPNEALVVSGNYNAFHDDYRHQFCAKNLPN